MWKRECRRGRRHGDVSLEEVFRLVLWCWSVVDSSLGISSLSGVSGDLLFRLARGSEGHCVMEWTCDGFRFGVRRGVVCQSARRAAGVSAGAACGSVANFTQVH